MATLVIGVAGGMGAGKSSLARRLATRFGARLIMVDEERRQIGGSAPDGFAALWELTREATLDRARQMVADAPGVVLLEWAMLAEDGFAALVHKAIVAECPRDERLRRLAGGDLTRAQIIERMDRQAPDGAAAAALRALGIPTTVLDSSSPISDEALFDAYDELAGSEFSSSASFCLFRIPRLGGRVIWEVTNSCNYGCRYCIFSSTPRQPEGELSTARALGVVDELAAAGFTHIKFTGGEPFLRPDLMQILRHARSRGFKTDLSTNAALVDEQAALALATLGLEMAHVSLDGHTQRIQESARGARTYGPTVAGIKALAGKGIPLRVGCVVFKGNQDHLMDIASFCHGLGCDEVIFSLMEPAGRMRGQTRDLCDIDPAILRSRIQAIAAALHGKIKVGANLPHPVAAGCGSCPGGERFLFIDHKGSVSPCTWVSEVAPSFNSEHSLRTHVLADILGAPAHARFRKTVSTLRQSGLDRCPAKAAPTLLLADRAAQLFGSRSGPGELGRRLLAGGRFSETAPLYLFSNENMSAWIDALQVSGKDVLLTGGSADGMICALAAGARSASNFDVNWLAKPLAELKLAMLDRLSRTAFLSFFDTLCFESYQGARPTLALGARHFFDQAYAWAGSDGAVLRASPLFRPTPPRHFLERNIPYLASDAAYLAARSACAGKPLSWSSQTAESAGAPAPAPRRGPLPARPGVDGPGPAASVAYGAIALSNIADYASLEYGAGADYLAAFHQRVAFPMSRLLVPGGKLLIAYVFGSDLALGPRSRIDDAAGRMASFGAIPGLDYHEQEAPAAWGGSHPDRLALWTRAAMGAAPPAPKRASAEPASPGGSHV